MEGEDVVSNLYDTVGDGEDKISRGCACVVILDPSGDLFPVEVRLDRVIDRHGDPEIMCSCGDGEMLPDEKIPIRRPEGLDMDRIVQGTGCRSFLVEGAERRRPDGPPCIVKRGVRACLDGRVARLDEGVFVSLSLEREKDRSLLAVEQCRGKDENSKCR